MIRNLNRHWPFVRCTLAWEDPWSPCPTDRWHFCARHPGHDGHHEAIDGTTRA